ncbi:globin-like protein [Ampelomyces quisqualis]|uniref:nitric oxide dioxygenase n=1 Tax=Ampelomyces quisqualis TaxID=50730 RepID=A0A6A5Q947_AMPQU|nr:globin-like protein [Ampelomyces quisqualis]
MATLTPSQVQIIKATVPVLAEHGNSITTKMYADMIDANPDLRNIFNHTHQATGHQARALAGALLAYAAHIDDLGVLSPALQLICHKHVSLYIRAEHYDIVGANLLESMKTVLGEAGTSHTMDAWGAAYRQLANTMISKEDGMYQSAGWHGWKEFYLARKVRESEDITSFYLMPVEAKLMIPVYKPGQYVSVRVKVDELDGGVWQARQYSLSDAPGQDHVRISVKKEPSIEIAGPKHMAHKGYVSNMLHEHKSEGDVIRVSHPFGDFYFEDKDEDKDAPVVLISAGVGLTCLMSILNTLVQEKSSRLISWIHGARDSDTRAFRKHVDALAANNERVRAVYFDSNPKDGEVEGQHFDVRGRIDLDKIGKDVLFIDNDKTQYFACGPAQFMLDVDAKLRSYGVPAERVKLELFGTGGVPRA